MLVDSRILCRMRAVHAAYKTNDIKYKSAGRLLYVFPGFLCDESHFGELAARQGGLPVFHRAKPGCKVFLYIAPAGRHQNPLNHLNPLNLLNLWIEADPRPLSKNHFLNFRNPIHIGHFLPFKHGSLFLSFQSGEDTDESGAGPAASENVGVGVAADVDFIVL